MKKFMKRFFVLVMCFVIVTTTGCKKTDETLGSEVMQEASTVGIITEIETIEPETSNPSEDTIVKSGLDGKKICVDAGHGIFKQSRKEAVAPNSSEQKAAFVSGTSGKTYSEQELNLIVAKKLQKALEDNGARVVMTRTTAECELSNVDRAKLANESGVDLTIRLHADGSTDSSLYGMSMLLPSAKYISDNELIEKSKKVGELVLESAVEATGARNRGTVERSDMTGFNWSEVPVILLEMGFMTNSEEDKKLSEDDYQDKIVKGIVNGLEKYFS